MSKKTTTKGVLVQSNQLIEGTYNCGIDEMRFLHLAMLRSTPQSHHSDDILTIRASEFSDVFDIPISKSYDKVKEAARKLLRTAITVHGINEDGTKITTEFGWFEVIGYETDKPAEIYFTFHKFVRQNLYDLKKEFTKLNMESIAALNTPFSIRLYSWLMRYQNLSKHQHEGGVQLQLSLDWIRERGGFGADSYPDFKHFKVRVIEPAVKNINNKTDVYLTYRQIKTGRKTTALEFFYIAEPNGIANKDHSALPPSRPRLPKRPQVVAGSHAEGEWARKGIKTLTVYAEQLKPFNKVLTLADLRRLHEYYCIIGDTLKAQTVQADIDQRKNKRDKKAS